MFCAALRQLAVLLLLAFVPAALSGAFWIERERLEPPGADEVRLETAKKLGSQVVWVDARDRAEFERAHIPGAVLLNEKEWVRLVGPFLEAWGEEKTIVVYGDAARARAVAQRITSELGVGQKVRVLQGGWDAWRDAP